MASREERESMRQAAEQLRQQQQRQRDARVQARLNEEAAVNRAARDEATSDRDVADFIKQLNRMTPKQIENAAKDLKKQKTRLTWGQKRALKKAREKGK